MHSINWMQQDCQGLCLFRLHLSFPLLSELNKTARLRQWTFHALMPILALLSFEKTLLLMPKCNKLSSFSCRKIFRYLLQELFLRVVICHIIPRLIASSVWLNFIRVQGSLHPYFFQFSQLAPVCTTGAKCDKSGKFWQFVSTY